MPRFERCPKCFGTDVEILEDNWICWDCTWEAPINGDERDHQETGK